MRPWKRCMTTGESKASPRSDFEEFFESLNAEGVRYLVVGGYALAYHARPRYTKDLDIWIEPDRGNANRVLRALRAFGFGGIALGEEDFSQPDRVVQMGFPPNRIDLITSVEGLAFAEAWERRVEALFESVTVKYLSLEDLVTNKRAVNRPQDRKDIRTLNAAKRRREKQE